jgi:membrane protease YdiL (CAAX protease family)
MRFFAKLLIAIAAAALIGGLFTYPAWRLVGVFADYGPDRVMHRVGQILLAGALWWILRTEGQADKRTFGYGISRPVFLRHIVVGFISGLLLILPLVTGLLWLGVRTWNSDAALSLPLTFAEGIIAGFAVAFVEETLVRGAMFSAMERESGAVVATVLTSLLFAAAHFLQGSLQIPANEMNFAGGLRIAADMFSQYATPLRLADAFCALFALAVLLALIRLRTGAIGGSIGLHAGGVAVIFVVSKFSVENPHAEPQWLIPSYNNVVGWVSFVWIAIVTAIYWQISRDKRRSHV